MSHLTFDHDFSLGRRDTALRGDIFLNSALRLVSIHEDVIAC